MSSVQEFAWAGSVSWGTMRPMDLIPRFMEVLEALNPMEAEGLERDFPLVLGVHDRSAEDSEAYHEQEDICLDALFDALKSCAPDGYYFGSTEGDGCDYGFWRCEEESDSDE